MTIIELVRKKKEEMGMEKDPSREVSRRNQQLAIAALLGGIHSRAWETYMQQFAETTDQLMRLKATDGTLGNESLDRKRAYLVSNAICGSTTVGGFDNWVDTIDEGLVADFQPTGDDPDCDPGW
jgi:hypothetical protein